MPTHRKLMTKINQKYPALQIIYKETFTPRPLKIVNFSELLMNRSEYLAAAPKNKKVKKNMRHLFIKMLNDGPEYCSIYELMNHVAAFKLKLDQKLIENAQNLTETIGKKKKAKQRVTLHEMAKFYLSLHPTENPPPIIPKKSKTKKSGGKKQK